ncbi:hypothetical protein CIT292_08007 [Citrobacter youngae ATCC 29220]|uniref:Uncharacterized protein n=1 Tax=Citrobacter youngae ATCC 29220 TaxID=500640 RepID=D4BC64_9ENTR|nr:hypothetical protein CIT292_08007 [Citrobacter youngae ATCC 29220]
MINLSQVCSVSQCSGKKTLFRRCDKYHVFLCERKSNRIDVINQKN